MHTGQIELAIARYLDTRINLIVPNVYWGLGLRYEVDLLVLTQSKYAYEIEIKTSISDLKADLKKRHQHDSNKFKRLYFAMPLELKLKALELIPERAGLFIVHSNSRVELVKTPKLNPNARKLTELEIQKLYELSAMRVWNLKEIVYNLQKRNKSLFNNNLQQK